MGPNDAQIVRVFSREAGGAISDVTIDWAKDAEVVVEVEAGWALHENGGKYRIALLVKDITKGDNVPLAPGSVVAGLFGDGDWPDRAHGLKFTIAKAELAARKGHFLQAYGMATYGTKNNGGSSAVSPLISVRP